MNKIMGANNKFIRFWELDINPITLNSLDNEIAKRNYKKKAENLINFVLSDKISIEIKNKIQHLKYNR
jgi:hypothetical protein